MAEVPGVARGMGVWVQVRPAGPHPDDMECCRCGSLQPPEEMWSAMIRGHHGAILSPLGGFMHCRVCMLLTDATQAWVDANAKS